MAIGYIGNLSNLQQGNQSVVNSMAGLGQSIAGAIETHAATQSAQAMLPMLQQQYQNGMEKISAGKPEGLADIYEASMIASQNPILAPMAKGAINTGTAAMIQAQHSLRTLAAQQGAMERYQMRYGTQAGRAITGNKQADVIAKYRGATQGLWSGTKDNPGASEYLNDFLDPKGDPSKAQKFGNAIDQYAAYKQDMAQMGIPFTDPNFENSILAKQAIASGKDPAKVMERLKSLSVPSSKMTAPAATPSAAPSATPAATPGTSMIPAASSSGLASAEPEEPKVTPEEPEEESQSVANKV